MILINIWWFFTADMYPWQACLDENTNCYYYWNVETNEVQWHPPELVSAVPDTQTADDSNALSIPQLEDHEEVEQGFQEGEDCDASKGDDKQTFYIIFRLYSCKICYLSSQKGYIWKLICA